MILERQLNWILLLSYLCVGTVWELIELNKLEFFFWQNICFWINEREELKLKFVSKTKSSEVDKCVNLILEKIFYGLNIKYFPTIFLFYYWSILYSNIYFQGINVSAEISPRRVVYNTNKFLIKCFSLKSKLESSGRGKSFPLKLSFASNYV